MSFKIFIFLYFFASRDKRLRGKKTTMGTQRNKKKKNHKNLSKSKHEKPKRAQKRRFLHCSVWGRYKDQTFDVNFFEHWITILTDDISKASPHFL